MRMKRLFITPLLFLLAVDLSAQNGLVNTNASSHGQSIAEKVAKLSAFIGEDLDARAAHGLHASRYPC